MKLTISPHPYADWFFPLVSLRIIKLYRIALGVVTFLTALTWVRHAHAFFSSEGFVSSEYVLSTSTYSHISIFFLYDAPWFVYISFVVFFLACLGLIFGKGGRLSAILAWLLFISCASRFPAVFYGGIDMLHMLLFFNMWHPGDGYQPWSYGGLEERSRIVPAWSMRMIQVSLCLVYFFAAAYKIRSNTWFNGTEILASLSTRFGSLDFYWLHNYPIIVNLMSYFSWFAEATFPLLVWTKSGHRFALVVIAGMHIGVRFMMNASLFSEIMLVALVSFINPEDEVRIGALWDTYSKRFRAGWERNRQHRRAVTAK